MNKNQLRALPACFAVVLFFMAMVLQCPSFWILLLSFGMVLAIGSVVCLGAEADYWEELL